MCSGAMRTYLLELDALPETTLISMVPVGLNAKQSQSASAEGGNAVGSVMVRLGTQLPDPADRLQAVHHSMRDGKEALVVDDAAADPGDERAGPGAGHPARCC